MIGKICDDMGPIDRRNPVWGTGRRAWEALTLGPCSHLFPHPDAINLVPTPPCSSACLPTTGSYTLLGKRKRQAGRQAEQECLLGKRKQQAGHMLHIRPACCFLFIMLLYGR